MARHNGTFNDLQLRESSPVSRRHFVVELLHCTIHGQVPVLLVGVVEARSTLVSHPEAIGFHFRRIFLIELVACNDLTVRLFHLLVLLQEIPELTLGDNFIFCPQLHAVQLRRRVLFRGYVSAYDLILSELKCWHYILLLQNSKQIENQETTIKQQ